MDQRRTEPKTLQFKRGKDLGAQAQKRLAKVQKAINDLLPPLYDLSRKIFLEVKVRFQEYKKGNDIPPAQEVGAEEAQKVVQSVFRERVQEIEETSLEVGRDVVRKYGLGPALEAWIFARRYIIKNKGMLSGVPVIWKGVDDYFKRFLPQGQLEALAKEEEADGELQSAQSELERIVSKAPPRLDLSGPHGGEATEPGQAVPEQEQVRELPSGSAGDAEKAVPPTGAEE